MKKIILFGSALLVSIGIASAQTPGVTLTGAYDDFADTDPVAAGVQGYEATDDTGIYWFGGAGWTRAVGTNTATNSTATVQYYGVNFGTDESTDPDTKIGLDFSSMADIEVDVENGSSTSFLSVRIVLQDNDGKETQIEPNVSDCDLVEDESTPLEGVSWPEGWNGGDPAVYPRPAYNGFILKASQRRTFRIDLSSVPGNVGGRKAGTYTGGTPSTMPASSYDFDPAHVHAVLFIINEGTQFTFSNGGADAGGYKFDSTASAGQSDFVGSFIMHSFKMGSVLEDLEEDPNPPTSVMDAMVNNSLKVYPNPAKDLLNVSFEASKGSVVSLSDLSGHTLYSTSTNAGQSNVSVNTSAFQAGMYLLNVSTEKGKVARLVTIQ